MAQLASERPELEFVGVDSDPRMIDHARWFTSGENVRYELADFVGERPAVLADFAYGIDVLHHVHELPSFLAGRSAGAASARTWLGSSRTFFIPTSSGRKRMRRAGLDEDHFRPWVAEPGFSRRLRIAGPALCVPLSRLCAERAETLARIESVLERLRPIGGSVVYRLERLPS